MQLEIYLVDAFAEETGKGNPAGVIFIENGMEITPNVMQKAAFEIKASETAFIYHDKKNYHIRWFSPLKEMPLCGHATMAAAKVIFEKDPALNDIVFSYKDGSIEVHKDLSGSLAMNFPMDDYVFSPVEKIYGDFFRINNFKHCMAGKSTGKIILVTESDIDLSSINPDYTLMKNNTGIYSRGIGLTKKSIDYDFETRYFNPWAGVDEDPVTGSIHTVLGHYWSDKLGKNNLVAYQNSWRPGILELEIKNQGIIIKGKAVISLQGKMFI